MGIWEIFLIGTVVVVFFGSQKLPLLIKAFGEAKKEFKKSLFADDGRKKDTSLQDKYLIDVTESKWRGRK